MGSFRLPPPNPLTTICVWIAAIFIAIREGAEKTHVLPGLVSAMSGVWSYLPLAVLVFAAAVYLVNLFRPHRGLATHAELRLWCQGTAHPPTQLSQTNIWRWFMMTAVAQVMPPGSGPPGFTSGPIGAGMSAGAVILNHTLYLTFDRPMSVGTMVITSPDMTVPLHEVKDFSSRSAVISFGSGIPAGTLVVTVRP